MSDAVDTSSDKRPRWSNFSLRKRYLIVTTLITFIILAGALYTQHYVKHIGEVRSENLRLRNNASIHIRKLRDFLLNTEKNLDAFLWLPDEQRRTQVVQAMDSAIIEQQHLYKLTWFTNNHMEREMDDFSRDLVVLRESIIELMNERTDPLHQDPYLVLRSELFQPATHEFNRAITSALKNIEHIPDNQLRLSLHKNLESLRSEWIRIDIMVESYSGISPNNQSEDRHTLKNIISSHNSVIKTLTSLKRGFDTTPQLKRDWQQIQLGLIGWDKGLVQLQTLVNEGKVRGDIHFLVTGIEPQLRHIWSYLQTLDDKLEAMSSHDADELEYAATTIARALWGIAFLGLGLLLIALIYFERNILSPISLVAQALRAEARGYMPPPLPPVLSRESHHLIDAFNQMRQQVKQRQKSLEYLALHDSLTGISNREQLVRTMAQESASPFKATLLVIGLNRFKEINNSLGHNVGDQLLIAVAHRLKQIKIAKATLARVGGDEFALLSCDERANGEIMARQVRDALEAPFAVANQSLFISASIGIAAAPMHGHDPLALLQKAEAAMHVAKKQKSAFVYYNSDHDQHAARRLSLASDLRRALNDSSSELAIAYQPQIAFSTGRFCGMEALLRWHHPVEGMIKPEELIPIAENTGIIFNLTRWVMDRAFKEYAALEWRGEKPQLAINISVFNLYDNDFPNHLEQMMAKWEVDPANLQLEITESAMMADPQRAKTILQQISQMGLELAIDDFGTGFSSLAYLKHLPVSKLKIDKSFVMSMLHSDNDAVIIRSTIDMAHNLGLQVVAEGVEANENFDLLSILNCDIAQGYLIGRPLAIHELEQWQIQRPQLGFSSAKELKEKPKKITIRE